MQHSHKLIVESTHTVACVSPQATHSRQQLQIQQAARQALGQLHMQDGIRQGRTDSSQCIHTEAQ